MRVTVCELSGHPSRLDRDWASLSAHVATTSPELVVLPEMPFFEWLPATRRVSNTRWIEAVDAHAEWLKRLPELGAVTVAGTRPILSEGLRYNEGFVWSATGGYQPTHRKTFLPDEPGFWEASWYARGPVEFQPHDAGGARMGFQICTEIWFPEYARAYGKGGVQLLCMPRATPAETLDRWLAAARVTALISGAFCVSSNHAPDAATVDLGVEMAGAGWITSPTNGLVIAMTSSSEPAVTVDLDLTEVAQARTTYPRYVADGPITD